MQLKLKLQQTLKSFTTTPHFPGQSKGMHLEQESSSH